MADRPDAQGALDEIASRIARMLYEWEGSELPETIFARDLLEFAFGHERFEDARREIKEAAYERQRANVIALLNSRRVLTVPSSTDTQQNETQPSESAQ